MAIAECNCNFFFLWRNKVTIIWYSTVWSNQIRCLVLKDPKKFDILNLTILILLFYILSAWIASDFDILKPQICQIFLFEVKFSVGFSHFPSVLLTGLLPFFCSLKERKITLLPFVIDRLNLSVRTFYPGANLIISFRVNLSFKSFEISD